MITIQDYQGREQSYVKHVFLERYLERLVYKIASQYDYIAYVDGFAGPWQSANEQFQDTSFGIALTALRNAKAIWKRVGRDVQMSAFLVECEAGAYNKLSGISPRYPDIHIKTYPGDFLKVFLEVLRDILSTAFAFFFIDPKGWRIPLRALTKMLERRNSEVVFNFMFDFINRAANIKDPAVIAGLDELIPYGNWRVQLEEAERCRATSDERKEILVDAFSQSLTKLGAYHFVAETTILRPLSDRPLYCLCYATRHPKGIEVFRDCQIQALEEQAKTRAERKVKHTEAITGQREIFQSLHDMAPNELEMFLETERAKAKHTLLSLAPLAPESIVYDAAWPRVLAKHVVRKPDVNRSAAQLRQANQLNFLDWEKSKRVPQGHYKMQRLQTRS